MGHFTSSKSGHSICSQRWTSLHGYRITLRHNGRDLLEPKLRAPIQGVELSKCQRPILLKTERQAQRK